MVRSNAILFAKEAFEKMVLKRSPVLRNRFTEKQKPEVAAVTNTYSKLDAKIKQAPVIKKKIIDSAIMNVKGGAGGCGNPKLRGKGGNGGNIYFIATKGETLTTLKEKLPYNQIVAESGGDATPKNCCLGKNGVDKWIPVPVGVNIYDNLGNYLGALSKEGHSILVANGGKGGSANNKFKINGGATVSTKIELQVVADVGLVGFESAGKSTLVHQLVTPIHAKVPTTEPTLYAKIKKMVYPDQRHITVMDTPAVWLGISADGNRHGQQLLKYLRRTRLLLLCLDATGYHAGTRKLTLFESFLMLNKEFEIYHPDIVKKPVLVVVNKFYAPESQYDQFEDQMLSIPEILPSVPKIMRPSKIFDVKQIIGMDLSIKDEVKLNILWEKIRRSLDIYEQERIQNQIEYNRQMRNSNRAT